MLYRTLAALLCTLVLLREADCRLRRRHHYRDEDHRHRAENHTSLAEDHPSLAEDHHQEDDAQLRRDELLALQHSERVTEFGTCGVPKPQVIHVSDHYPGRYFLPHCTVLHRCGRHSGCCGTDHLRCVAVEHEKVVLPFYSVRAEEVRPGGKTVRRVEKLAFTNHTRCGCALNYKAMSRNDL